VEVVPVRALSDWRRLVDFRLGLYPELPLDFMLHRLADAWKTAQVLDGDWWCIREQGEVIGSMGLFWRDGLARYQDVDIRPDRHGKGLGRLMFHTVRARSEASGAFDAQIIVADRGSLAHAWYQRMGFTPIQGEVFAFRQGPQT
jgi:GNAT superfamily N-acetyltransferase